MKFVEWGSAFFCNKIVVCPKMSQKSPVLLEITKIHRVKWQAFSFVLNFINLAPRQCNRLNKCPKIVIKSQIRQDILIIQRKIRILVWGIFNAEPFRENISHVLLYIAMLKICPCNLM